MRFLREFDTWNLGISAVAIVTVLAVGAPLCWWILAIHLAFATGLLVGFVVLRRPGEP